MSGAVAAIDLDLEELAGRLFERRWFGGKSRGPTGVRVVDAVALGDGPDAPTILLVEVDFAAGPAETYQLPIVIAAEGERPERARLAAAGDGVAYDLLAGREDPPRLLAAIVAGGDGEIDADREPADDAGGGDRGGRVVCRWIADGTPPAGAQARPLAGEQSNSSVIFGENAILKAFRRLEPGVNPELEMLRFLSARGFDAVPALFGWYEYRAPSGPVALGLVQEFLADGRDGWEWTLDGLAGDPDSLLEPLRGLGTTVGAMHSALAADHGDPDFAPAPLDGGALAGLVADLGARIERLFAGLSAEDGRLAPIADSAARLRERLRELARVDAAGQAIRVHGDLHLGQTLRSDRGWTLLDFEGEPARSLAERRARHSPLRDVAGMLRSLAYAPLAARFQREAAPPADWEGRARERLLDGYLEAVEPSLLPPSRAAVDGLLAIYELEKAVYELAYELDNRPDWVEIPVAGIARLLEVEVA